MARFYCARVELIFHGRSQLNEQPGEDFVVKVDPDGNIQIAKFTHGLKAPIMGGNRIFHGTTAMKQFGDPDLYEIAEFLERHNLHIPTCPGDVPQMMPSAEEVPQQKEPSDETQGDPKKPRGTRLASKLEF